jgi:tetratricopeptide (TPR) repeat protein
MASMSLQAAYDQARQWLESNDLDRAIGLAQHVLDHYPDNLEVYRILGEAYLANRQLDRAQESFARVLRSDPENIPAHVGLGITFERQGQLDRAVAEFEQALEIKPDMAELRSQLLRLYTEGWGSENAQLRLSRAGLARLYAKGHMLPQAISEFRQVIADQPGRSDAMVALAETLWRDGQEDEAMNLCRDILASRPESLKANLLLGYLLMTSGDPEGERYWQAAQRMDPYHGVARALFETLPPGSEEQPAIEEWDEDAWRQRRATEQQEQIAATRPMEAITPVGTAVPSPPLAGMPRLAQPLSRSTASVSSGDDFLASLLAIDTPALPQTSAAVDTSDEDLGLGIDMAPFSLDDLNGEQPPAQSPFADAATTPTPEPASELAADDEPTMTPFSLADLGLSEEEIAGMDSLSTPEAAATPTPTPEPAADDEPAMTPFSLADLGLSEEEIASMDSLSTPEAAATPTPTPEPDAEDDDIKIAPFSLSDLGLSDEEIAGLESLQTEGEQRTTPPAASSSAPSTPDADTDLPDMSDLPLDLQPFSIDELDLGSEDMSPSSIGELPPALQPFSLDEQPPQRPRVSSFISPESAENEGVTDEEDFPAETRGYSWQQASQKPGTNFLKSPREEPASEGSIFAKLKQRHLSNPESREDEPLPPVPINEDEHLGLFSLDDISLRDDVDTPQPQPPAVPEVATPAAPAPEIENLQDALASGQIQPFSFADLGLSDEEIAALGVGEASSSAAPAEPYAAVPEIENLQDALESGQVQPFSLSDLGLSEEEIAAMGGETALDTPTNAPTSEPAQVRPAAEADDFNSYLEAPSATSDQATQPSTESSDEGPQLTSDLKPFSLTDLGLSAEEIDALGLDIPSEAEDSGEMGLGLTEEELEGLDGGDLKWALESNVPAPSEPASPVPSASESEAQLITGDLMVDRLIALGRQQGYIDISDIIAGFEDPEAEAARIEEIGRRLHDAKIEIRDGDEVIDMDADLEEEETADEDAPDSRMPAPEMPPPAPSSHEVSADESDRLGLAEVDTSEPVIPEQQPIGEPELTPFSLSELGLSEDEINALGLGEPVAEAQTPAPAEQPAEPDLTPFSLSELGLSEDEIAALGLGEPMPTPDVQATEPAGPPSSGADLTPVSAEAAPVAPEPPLDEAPPPAEPTPAATPTAETPAVHPARGDRDDEPPIFTGNEVLDTYLHQLEADPQNDILRLSVARIGGQIGMADLAVQHYKYLIKNKRLLDQVVEELSDLISDNDDGQLLQRLHRVLGDAYTKQGRFREAVDEYSWTLGGPRGTR